MAKRLIVNEIQQHQKEVIHAALDVFMKQGHPAIPNHLSVPHMGIAPMTHTMEFPREGITVPMTTAAATSTINAANAGSITLPSALIIKAAALKTPTATAATTASGVAGVASKAVSWLEHAGKVLAADLSKADVVLKNVLPIAQVAALAFSFTPYGAIAATVVQVVVMTEGAFASADSATGTGVQKAQTVINQLGGVIANVLSAAGQASDAASVKNVIDEIVTWLNNITPDMLTSLQQAISEIKTDLASA